MRWVHAFRLKYHGYNFWLHLRHLYMILCTKDFEGNFPNISTNTKPSLKPTLYISSTKIHKCGGGGAIVKKGDIPDIRNPYPSRLPMAQRDELQRTLKDVSRAMKGEPRAQAGNRRVWI